MFELVCICVKEREQERVCVGAYVWVRVYVSVCVCACVCMFEARVTEVLNNLPFHAPEDLFPDGKDSRKLWMAPGLCIGLISWLCSSCTEKMERPQSSKTYTEKIERPQSSKKGEQLEENDAESPSSMYEVHMKYMKQMSWKENNPGFLLVSEEEFRKNTPSRQQKISYEEEMELRITSSTLIHNISAQWEL